MNRPVRLPSVFTTLTTLTNLLNLRDRLAGLFRARRAENRPAKLALEPMEERLVPDGRPLPFPVIFASSDAGVPGIVKAFDADTGALRWSTPVFGSGFEGGVRVAAGDITGDGIPDAIVAPGAGHAPRVKVLDGTTGEEIGGALGSLLAFGSGSDGGVFVASGDVNGDGRQDVIATTLTGAGPRVKAFSGTDGSVLANFVVPGTAFAGGATVGAADFTGDGKAEVVVGGSGGRVRVYDPLTGELAGGGLGERFQRPFGADYTGSVFIGTDELAGDVDGDSVPDLAVGTGAGVTTRVKVFSGATGEVLYNFRPFGADFEGGARVALSYVDDDARADIVVGSGPGIAGRVKVFSGATGERLDDPLGRYAPFGAFDGGVFVGASNDPVITSFTATPSSQSYAVDQTVAVTLTVATDASAGYAVFFLGWGDYTESHSVELVSGAAEYTFTRSYHVAGGVGFSAWVEAYDSDDNLFGVYEGAGDFTIVSSTGPVAAAPGQPCPPGVVATPKGMGLAQGGYSASGVNYGSGAVVTSRTDLASGAFGDAWGVAWSYTTASGYGDGTSGTGATTAGTAHAVQVNGNDSIALVTSASTALFFDYYGGAYHARYGQTAMLTHDTTNHVFVVTDGTGRTLTFYDFSGSTPTGRAGKLKSVADVDGQLTQVTSWDGNGRPTEVQRTTGSGGSALTESFVYAYVASGTNAGRVSSVTQRTQVGGGSWGTVRSVEYTYHDGTTAAGTAGALRTATVKDAGGAALDTAYYRYYTSGTGSTGKLSFAFGNDAYARLVAALGSSVDGLTDAQVDDYADKYAAYDSSGRATTVVDAAAGCSVCSGGQGTFTYAYSTNAAASALLDPNAWTNKTVETLPDGSTNTVYTNALGQVMLTARSDGTSTWLSYTRYDAAGRVVLTAAPSAVTGYSESYADLVNFVSGNAAYLSDSTGLFAAYTYGTSTTATSSTAGDALGYLKAVDLKQGETGAAVPQQTVTYFKNTVGGIDFFNPASETVYRNDNGTGGITTSYSYTFASGTNQIASTTVTLPTVTTAQNGSNSATTVTTVNDAFGRPVWAKDQGGFLSYTQYDDLTGAVVKTITDVDTTQTGTFANLPSGWSTPAGAGLHRTTSYEVDALGRVIKMTAPNGRVDYTVYNDAAHEVRSYVGWDTGTNRPTGPTTVTRVDRGNGYTETLTMSAAPNVSSGRPTGTESIAQVQSLSRDYVNAAGQMIQSDAYFNLSGLAYSTSATLGTEGVNFYRTRYQYDDTGAVKRVQTPEGTITRTVRDPLGRVVSEWVGTDDTPTSGFWSPTNTAGTNLVKVREYQYDGGGVGNGNLTTVTEYPGGGAAARVTQTWFDWRDRAVATKSGVEASESTSVNRPLTYTDYDNLGRATKTRMYDADGVTPTVTSGVPQPLSASLLRAQTETEYDELGRAFRTKVYSVNPSSGAVSTNGLVTSLWYDARGLVVKQSVPNGLVQKSTYDGAGRVVTSYTSDGGGDSGYADADDVTGDLVLTQVSYEYDASGNVLKVTTRERNHDATGTGTIGAPSGIAARASFVGYYYDLADRLTASVNVGTNAGSSWTRPGSVPTGSATVLVTATRYATDAVQSVTLTGAPTGGTFTLSFGGQTTSALAYNASAAAVQSALAGLSSIGIGNVVVSVAPGGAGWEVRFTGALAAKYQSALTANGAGLTGGTSPGVAVSTVNAGGDAGRGAEMTDAAGRVSHTYSDALGRTTRTVQNFVDGVVSDADDKTVGYTYNGAGMTALTAYTTGGGGQTTQYVYGVTVAGGSAVESNDMVGVTKWPDPSTGAASSSEQEVTTVNALGQALTMTDRNGSVHTLTYDVLGRVVSDAVTTLGSGVDGSVRRIETAYDAQGNVSRITSYDAASGGSIVNQVLRDYNGLGQLITEWQEHGGAVVTSTSPKVQYAYNFNGSGTVNQSRLTSVTYPSGYVLTYNYSSGINYAISRLSSLSDSTGTLESYQYLGLATVVVRAHPQPNVDLSYVKLAGESVGDAGDQYTGLDRLGRVVDQRWLNPGTGTATDRFQYGYDAAGNRTYRDNLTNTAFGEVYTYDALDQLASFDRGTLNGTKTGISGTASRTQDWDYDAVGNFDSVTTNGTAQTRTANAQNEITGIAGATTPTYDSNGNMTGDETGKQFVYDAWNRLVAVKSSGGTTLKTYEYDGLNRRVSETVVATSTTTDLFYSDQWQVLEEKVGSSTRARYVWSPVYVDAMALRDRDTDANGTLDERLWVQQDANWNVTALVSGSGAVVERYGYDPYGARTVYDASFTVRSGSSYGFTHGFQGLAFDATSGLNEADRRWYSPSLSRWVTLDPIQFAAGDVNLYGFVGNGPNSNIDPSGLKKHSFPIAYSRGNDDIQEKNYETARIHVTLEVDMKAKGKGYTFTVTLHYAAYAAGRPSTWEGTEQTIKDKMFYFQLEPVTPPDRDYSKKFPDVRWGIGPIAPKPQFMPFTRANNSTVIGGRLTGALTWGEFDIGNTEGRCDDEIERQTVVGQAQVVAIVGKDRMVRQRIFWAVEVKSDGGVSLKDLFVKEVPVLEDDERYRAPGDMLRIILPALGGEAARAISHIRP